MKYLIAIFYLNLVSLNSAFAQNMDETPYASIPSHPSTYSASHIISRMIDGLGYRYYWATEGLRDEDLAHRPSDDARSTLETLEHVYELSETIVNTSMGLPNVRPAPRHAHTHDTLRSSTLLNFKKASDAFNGKSDDELQQLAVIFQRQSGTIEFPLWNLINGQISDALYHTGQIVSFRRASGNPMNPDVNVFLGKTGR